MRGPLWAISVPVLAAVLAAGAAAARAGELTVMPLGDSITKGATDDSGDGYRAPLYKALVAAHVPVRFVGATDANSSPMLTALGQQHHDGFGSYRMDELLANLEGERQPGNWADSDVGGHWMTGGTDLTYGSGKDVRTVTRPAVTPDVVLLLGGANDVGQNADLPTLRARTTALLDWFTAHRPTTVVIVGTATPFKNPAQNDRVKQFDAWLTQAVPSMASRRVFLAQTGAAVAGPGGAYNPALMSDGVHPNHQGYAAVADSWMTALRRAGLVRRQAGSSPSSTVKH